MVRENGGSTVVLKPVKINSKLFKDIADRASEMVRELLNKNNCSNFGKLINRDNQSKRNGERVVK